MYNIFLMYLMCRCHILIETVGPVLPVTSTMDGQRMETITRTWTWPMPAWPGNYDRGYYCSYCRQLLLPGTCPASRGWAPQPLMGCVAAATSIRNWRSRSWRSIPEVERSWRSTGNIWREFTVFVLIVKTLYPPNCLIRTVVWLPRWLLGSWREADSTPAKDRKIRHHPHPWLTIFIFCFHWLCWYYCLQTVSTCCQETAWPASSPPLIISSPTSLPARLSPSLSLTGWIQAWRSSSSLTSSTPSSRTIRCQHWSILSCLFYSSRQHLNWENILFSWPQLVFS